TDSHTTMINGLGVVGWGVGGIEAEAGMLGQPVYFLTPEVVGVHMTGTLREGVTATDLALHITQLLRAQKVVGKFVEFYGEGAALKLNIGDVQPSVAGPKRPQDRINLPELGTAFRSLLAKPVKEGGYGKSGDKLDERHLVHLNGSAPETEQMVSTDLPDQGVE